MLKGKDLVQAYMNLDSFSVDMVRTYIDTHRRHDMAGAGRLEIVMNKEIKEKVND